MDLSFQTEMQSAFAHFYNNSNYPTTVANALYKLLMDKDKYDGNRTLFQENFVKRTQMLLQTLKDNQLPLYRHHEQTMKILVHLAIPEKEYLDTGEFLICVGHSKPGTLTVRFCKWVTRNKNGMAFGKPMYDTVKMTVNNNSLHKCLTLGYFEDLRKTGKLEGTERTSVMFRLCWVKVLDEKQPEGFLKVYDADDLFDQKVFQRNQMHPPLSRGRSDPMPVQQNSKTLRFPQQESAETSFRSTVVRQQACDDDELSNLKSAELSTPPGEWQEDPLGMGGGCFVPTNSDNFNNLQVTSSDAPVVASKPPINEWQSDEDQSCNFLKSTESGGLRNSLGISGSIGPLPLSTGTLQDVGNATQAMATGSEVKGQNNPPKEVTSGYYKESDALSPIGTFEDKSKVKIRPAKEVTSGYYGEFEAVNPTATSTSNVEHQTHLAKDGSNDVKPTGQSDVAEKQSKPAKDVGTSRYVGEFESVGPKQT